MRISSYQMQQGAVKSMLDQQSELSHVQKQVATGQRITKPSEDPVAAAKIIDLRDNLAQVKQHQMNLDAARTRITLSEGVLDNTVDTLQRIRELAIQANNDSQDEYTRAYIAEEVIQLRDELLALANTTDSNNEYLFAGSLTKYRPFSRSDDGSILYNGDGLQREIQISRTRRIAADISGAEIFRQVGDGNGKFAIFDAPGNQGNGIIDVGKATADYIPGTYAIVFENQNSVNGAGSVVDELYYSVVDEKGNLLVERKPYQQGELIQFNGILTSVQGVPQTNDYFVIRPSQNQDVFTTVDQFIAGLRSQLDSDSTTTAFHNNMNRVLQNIDQSLESILAARSDLGARLNALDSQQSINEAYQMQIREILSEVEDLDYSKAVSELNLKLTGLEASQKAFTRVQNISLFNFL